MEKTLQHEETTQCFGLPPAGPGNHRPNGSKTDHALTFKLDYLKGADHYDMEDFEIVLKVFVEKKLRPLSGVKLSVYEY